MSQIIWTELPFVCDVIYNSFPEIISILEQFLENFQWGHEHLLSCGPWERNLVILTGTPLITAPTIFYPFLCQRQAFEVTGSRTLFPHGKFEIQLWHGLVIIFTSKVFLTIVDTLLISIAHALKLEWYRKLIWSRLKENSWYHLQIFI